jgi:hypothetical protein
MAEADSKSKYYSDAAEGWIDTAQEAAKGEVGPGVIVAGRRSTGRGGWTEDLKAFMRERPLMGTALMIGVGYVLGKSMRR